MFLQSLRFPKTLRRLSQTNPFWIQKNYERLELVKLQPFALRLRMQLKRTLGEQRLGSTCDAPLKSERGGAMFRVMCSEVLKC